MNDVDLMPYGKYKGEKMSQVPAFYLLWLHKKKKASREVETYIMMNWDELQKEYAENKER